MNRFDTDYFEDKGLPEGPRTKDIGLAVELPETPGSKYKILQLSDYRDRLNSGLEPLFDYYCIRGYFYKVAKTPEQVVRTERHRVPEFEPVISSVYHGGEKPLY